MQIKFDPAEVTATVMWPLPFRRAVKWDSRTWWLVAFSNRLAIIPASCTTARPEESVAGLLRSRGWKMISISHWGMFQHAYPPFMLRGFKVADIEKLGRDMQDPAGIIEVIPLGADEPQPLYHRLNFGKLD